MLIYNLTNNSRRTTRDLDIDFIRYPLSKESVDTFLQEISNNNEKITFERISELKELTHDDYRGGGFKIRIKQGKEKLDLKIDVGIHTYNVMQQKEIVLGKSIDGKGKIVLSNSVEQIVLEKLFATYRLGLGSGRYRDIDDIYYFISNKKLDSKVFKKYLDVLLKIKRSLRMN